MSNMRNIDKQFIIDNILSTRNRVKTLKLKEYDLTREDVHLIYHGGDIPRCPECDKQLKFIRFNIQNDGCYPLFCSIKCSNQSNIVVKKRQKTSLKLYGDEHYNNPTKNVETRLSNNNGIWFSDKQRKKFISTSLINYNEAHPFKSKSVIDKCEQTKLEKYGNKHYINIDKREQTNYKLYGGHSTFCSDEVQLKAKNTRILNGSQIADDKISDFMYYRKIVWVFTNKHHLASLDNFEKRGRSDLKPDAYSLDHMYSIKQGFVHNIPAHLIGSFGNLIMLPYDENRKKKDNCSVTIEEIMTAEGITDKLLALRKLEIKQQELDKWNGVLPTTVVNGNTPVIIGQK